MNKTKECILCHKKYQPSAMYMFSVNGTIVYKCKNCCMAVKKPGM